ncbi:fructosamine kinase family protein [Nitrosovibrio tenuis]|uniref:Fructosamine-3-kinase n=1 Tax=Nitrosovibrio tenuis TaxID=1233 RepID=A0A1H7NDI9_9PROT|nr:fructosamine kinase family protein [Nitrosovibrio tenuis]SEL21514.1 Fructosamine-3-kinase [Nitrosovibrio tenuis]
MSPWTEIAAQISTCTGIPFVVEKISSIGGGCINQAQRIEGNGRRFFVKLNDAESLTMFEAEAAGLQEIRDSHTVHVPEPVCWGKASSRAWLVLEYLEMGKASARGAAALGLGLAAMHRCASKKFGWKRNNTIGATQQINTYATDWVQFWREHRLGYQLKLAQANGHTGKLQISGEKLLATLDSFFPGAGPDASLLHGDLWSGNYGFDREGERPILFDPAVYYGDRETDIAMTELFGGFPAAFYAAYRESYPLDPGYDIRKTLYNLYHILNHLNLFGGSYRHQAEQMLSRLLAEVK